jgi:thiol-disulfide isomerase/thioredoxin
MSSNNMKSSCTIIIVVALLCLIVGVQSRPVDENELYDIAHQGVETPTIVKLYVTALSEPSNVIYWPPSSYSERCGFCVGLAPIWEAFEKQVIEEELNLDVVEFDITTITNQERIQSVLPGPLPGISLYYHFIFPWYELIHSNHSSRFVPGNTEQFYENFGARGIQKVDQILEWALLDYEEVEPTWINVSFWKLGVLNEWILIFLQTENYFTTKTDLFFVTSSSHWNELIKEEDAEYFIMFAGPKCGWCKQFLPVWQEFARLAKEEGLSVTVGWINGLKNFELIERYSARPWPSIV